MGETRPTGDLRAADCWLVIGQSFTGKTYHAIQIAKKARRVVVYDPAEDPQWMGFCRPTTVIELLERPTLLAAHECRLVVHPRPDDFRDGNKARPDEEQRIEIETLIELQRAAGNLLSVWDEVGDYGESANFALSKLARNGRHQGLAKLWISQSAIEIPKRVRRQATKIVSFLQTEPSDLSALAERCGEEYEDRVRAWRKGSPPVEWTLPSLEK